MHIFKNSSEAKEYENKVRLSVDSLLNAFEGGNYIDAIAVLDWMKEVVAEKATVVASDCSVTTSSPSFPLRLLGLKA